MRAQSVNFERGQKPSKSLDIGMTLERNRDLAMKMMSSIGLEPRKGAFQEEKDWFWIRFTKNQHRKEDYILWYIGEDFELTELDNKTYSSILDFPPIGWSLQDISILKDGYILPGSSLEEISGYVKSQIAEDYVAEISRFNDKIDDMNQILNLMKKN